MADEGGRDTETGESGEMIRWMCGVTLKDRCKSEELRKRLDIEDVADVVRKSRLGWFGHLERKHEGDWVSACRNMVVPGYAGKGRPRLI